MIFHFSLHPINHSLSQHCQLLLVTGVVHLLDTHHSLLTVLGGKLLGLLQPPGAADQLESCLNIPWLGELPEYELVELWKLLAGKEYRCRGKA